MLMKNSENLKQNSEMLRRNSEMLERNSENLKQNSEMLQQNSEMLPFSSEEKPNIYVAGKEKYNDVTNCGATINFVVSHSSGFCSLLSKINSRVCVFR